MVKRPASCLKNCQIIGVNSVTNIELDKGVMPAPIIRNADWFEKIAVVVCWPRSASHLGAAVHR
ncbi:hypothetical protein LGQ10_27385 [Pseudomonas sp. L5B5]|uniref:hypothetical protein n=1 Tax=Pseudomonas sp. L5B5 TaxID=2883205 RepID=UPI001CFC2654|nr:hypothetical protein [Pseudomonas sp. L5B5]UCZ87855.1 hypothetical protein LGQ10_27385 [Pseudomonas sp. L5B5]